MCAVWHSPLFECRNPQINGLRSDIQWNPRNDYFTTYRDFETWRLFLHLFDRAKTMQFLLCVVLCNYPLLIMLLAILAGEFMAYADISAVERERLTKTRKIYNINWHVQDFDQNKYGEKNYKLLLHIRHLACTHWGLATRRTNFVGLPSHRRKTKWPELVNVICRTVNHKSGTRATQNMLHFSVDFLWVQINNDMVHSALVLPGTQSALTFVIPANKSNNSQLCFKVSKKW